MESLETKRERFKRLAAKRTNQVLKSLEILGHCGNRHTYEYSAEEAKQIFLAIERKLNEVKMLYRLAGEEAFRF